MIQIAPIFRLALDLPNAGLDFTQHGEARAEANACEPGLEDSPPDDRGPVHGQANMVRVKQVGGHQDNPISRRMRSFS